MASPPPVTVPRTAPQWLGVALTEHRAAAEHTGGERRRHLEAARHAYQRVLDLCDPHCLAAAVRGLEALAAAEANRVALPAADHLAVELKGRRARSPEGVAPPP